MAGMMRAVLGVALVLALAHSANAGASVLLFNSSQVVPGFSQVYELDVASGTSKTLAGKVSSRYDWLGSTVVCRGGEAGVVYGTADNVPVATALGMFDIAAGKQTIFPSPGNIHAVGCGESVGTALALTSQSVDSKLLWSIYEFNTNSTSNKPTLRAVLSLGAFTYKGVDSCFRFVAETRELWIAAATGGFTASTGILFIVDSSSGAPKGQYNFPNGQGWPYMILPTGKSTFGVGLMTGNGLSGDVTFYQGSLSGSSVSVTNSRSAHDLFNGGAPAALCDGVAYIVSLPFKPTSGQTLTAFDPTTGAVTTTVNLQSVYSETYMYTVACPSP